MKRFPIFVINARGSHPLVTSVEADQVLKLVIGTDFCLLTTNNNLTKVPADYKKSFYDEILEWNGQTIQEEPIVSR